MHLYLFSEEKYRFHPWGPWSACAVTCQYKHDPNVYMKIRRRGCDEKDVRTASCPDIITHPELYREKQKCDIPLCEGNLSIPALLQSHLK